MHRTKLSFLYLLLVMLTGCCHRDEYQVYAIKFAEGEKIPAGDWVIGAGKTDSVDVCNMFWLLRSGDGRNIMVDAGFIDSSGNDGKYVRPDLALKEMKLAPEEISDIILTHPHPDHVGGITLFPNAHIWMQKADFEYFTGLSWLKTDSTVFLKKDVENILKLKKAGRVTLVEGDDMEIMPGIKVFTGSKHTFENQYLLINTGSEKNQILLASDAIWFYLNLEKLLPISICMDTAAYTTTMRRMLTLEANQKLIIPGHDNLVFSKFPKITNNIVKIED
ncbi:MAG TPA: N-acyl homoserine lactonase family protein [Bacteroidales bacterium]|nr:N-acyl homoserine lactonase family protein [Bacteroidales bacterium]HPS74603.1 N-acyl homoserine lactonase family protein [Bacteroidales bacterium]